MSKIDLTKKYTHEEYKGELNKLGIKHYSQEKSSHDMLYCGFCKHASLDHGSGEIGGWQLQSCCSRRDMTPVSEFCWCDRFIIDIESEYWKDYPKEMKELSVIIYNKRLLMGWEVDELSQGLECLTDAVNKENKR